MQKSTRSEDLHEILKANFGFSSFREHQLEVIEHVLEGNNALVLFPTGGGKSLCYQLPALVFSGVTLVVSPLIALMQDQVESLQQKGIAADYLNSSLNSEDAALVESRLLNSETKLLYVSPEKLQSKSFYDILRRIQLSFIAIDEAHCISEWGNDFRPEYANMAFLHTYFPTCPIIALTATADAHTQADILNKLNISDAAIFRTSFLRKNIAISIHNADWKQDQLFNFLANNMSKNGVVYCRSRQSVNALFFQLKEFGLSVARYHRNLSKEEKQNTLQGFLSGEINIVVATIAFGMGIDKPDIDFVIHMNVPRSVEQYYQEIGRAGRDGRKAEAIGFFSDSEFKKFQTLIEEEGDNEAAIRKLESCWALLNSGSCIQQNFCQHFGEFQAKKCGVCLPCTSFQSELDSGLAVQKLLSALFRFGKRAQIEDVISLLVGTVTMRIKEDNLHNISTFGCGKEHSILIWREIIQSALASCLMDKYHDEIIWNQNSSMAIQKAYPLIKQHTLSSYLSEETSEKLSLIKYWRNQLAKQNGLEGKEILNDFAIHRALIGNVSKNAIEQQISRYRNSFQLLNAIFQKSKTRKTQLKKGIKSSLAKTLEWFELGLSIDEIAQVRGIQALTVYSHLGELVRKGQIPMEQVISSRELQQVQAEYKENGGSDSLAHYVEKLSLPAGKIRVALCVLS